MYIQLQQKTDTLYIPIGIIYIDNIDHSNGLYVPLTQVENATNTLPSGMLYWDFLMLYQHYDKTCIEKVEDNYRINFNINKVLDFKKRQLEARTRDFITSDSPNEKRMPEWRQARWNEYCRLHDKKKTKKDKLTTVEQILFDGMINTVIGETEDNVLTKCEAAAQWIAGCLQAHATTVVQLSGITNIEDAVFFDINICQYPNWIGV